MMPGGPQSVTISTMPAARQVGRWRRLAEILAMRGAEASAQRRNSSFNMPKKLHSAMSFEEAPKSAAVISPDLSCACRPSARHRPLSGIATDAEERSCALLLHVE